MNPKHHTSLFRLLSLLAVCAILAASFPLPAAAAAPEARKKCASWYVVQDGDTLAKIAKWFDVRLDDLKDANNIKNDNDIDEGDELCIPVDSGKTGDKKFVWTTWLSGRRVYVQAEKSSVKRTFFVKVRSADYPGKSWTKLGKITTKKDAKSLVSFNLPDSVEDARRIEVCLKNISTNALYCKILSR